MLCSICFNEIETVGTWTTGNNAAPVNMGRCCNECDNNVVIPARITMLRAKVSNETYTEMLRAQFVELRRVLVPGYNSDPKIENVN